MVRPVSVFPTFSAKNSVPQEFWRVSFRQIPAPREIFRPRLELVRPAKCPPEGPYMIAIRALPVKGFVVKRMDNYLKMGKSLLKRKVFFCLPRRPPEGEVKYSFCVIKPAPENGGRGGDGGG